MVLAIALSVRFFWISAADLCSYQQHLTSFLNTGNPFTNVTHPTPTSRSCRQWLFDVGGPPSAPNMPFHERAAHRFNFSRWLAQTFTNCSTPHNFLELFVFATGPTGALRLVLAMSVAGALADHH